MVKKNFCPWSHNYMTPIFLISVNTFVTLGGNSSGVLAVVGRDILMVRSDHANVAMIWRM